MSAHVDFEGHRLSRVALRPMLAVCPAPGCTRLTMGGTCVEHDVPVTMTFPRGRPYLREPDRTPDEVVVPI
jgi:hypothetical protein